jgi:hypothetical protein
MFIQYVCVICLASWFWVLSGGADRRMIIFLTDFGISMEKEWILQAEMPAVLQIAFYLLY